MDDAVTQRPRGPITTLAGAALAVVLMTVGASQAQAIHKISATKLWCDKPSAKRTHTGAAKIKVNVKAGCVKRPVRAIKRSVVRKDFPTFRAQVTSDPRILVSGGRALTAGARSNEYTAKSSDSGSSDSSSSRSPVRPVLECVARDGANYVAHFGYNNPNTSRVEIAVGSSNKFVPGTGLGQPTLFQPGRVVDVFNVTFSGTLVWTLDGRTSTASASSKACATPRRTIMAAAPRTWWARA
jgi:hypothetical protein